MMKTYLERIVIDPEIKGSKPVIKGTRITVNLILKRLSEGMTIEELIEAYPRLTKEDILSSLAFSLFSKIQNKIKELHKEYPKIKEEELYRALEKVRKASVSEELIVR